MAWKGGYDGTLFTRADLKKFLDKIDAGKLGWVDHLTIHNTDLPDIAMAKKTPGGYGQRMKNIAAGYKQKGWSSGPHFVVFASGQIGLGTPLPATGTHSPSWNGNSIGVEMCADFDPGKDDPTTGDGFTIVDTAAFLFSELLKKLGKKANFATIRLHKEDPKTTHNCPGNAFKKDGFVGLVQQYMSGITEEPFELGTPAPAPVPDNIVSLTGTVMEWQQRLKVWGLDPGPLDGQLGDRTKAAINAFQKLMGIAATGIVGPWLWARLKDVPRAVPVDAPPVLPKAPQSIDNPHLGLQILVNEAKWPEHWAKAYIGHAQRESYPDLKPHIEGDWMLNGVPVKKGTPGAVSTAYGINQWRGPRKAALEAFSAARGTKWDDFETQVLFAVEELKTSEHLAWKWLQQADTLEKAVAALCFYERPKGYLSKSAKACVTWEDVFDVAQACDGYDARMAFAKKL